MQSAEILRDYLDIDRPIQTLYELNCEYDNLFPGQAKAIHQAILKGNEFPYAVGNFKLRGKENNLLLTAHYAIRDYAEYFMRQEWGRTISIDDVEKGQAIHLNLEEKTQRIIPE